MIRDASRTAKFPIADAHLHRESQNRTGIARSASLHQLHPQADERVRSDPTSFLPASEESSTFGADLSGELMGLRSYAIWLCRSKTLADDLIQETLVRAWAARDRFEAGTNLRAWCITILRNIFFSYKRRSWRSAPLVDEHVAELAAENEGLGHRLDLLALRNAIALLPDSQREAILLIGVGGASYVEVAEICACAVGTIKSRVSRARLRLAVLILENSAGFNSDPNVEAEEVLGDLMRQVSSLRVRREMKNRIHARLKASSKSRPVFSEPAKSA